MPRRVPCACTGDMSYAEAAARTVHVRAGELFAHAEGVLDTEDIERVHDMRVATRRLRAALEVFAPCFEPEAYAAALKDVKRLADALGARRDPDVHLEEMGALAERLGVQGTAGVEALFAQLRQEQRAGNAVLEKALARVRRRDLAGRLQALAEQAGPVRARAIEGLDPSAALAVNVLRILAVRVDELRSFMPRVREPGRAARAARHADRGQAAALRARAHRPGRAGRRGRPSDRAGQGRAGPARRDPRLRRDAAAPAGDRAHPRRGRRACSPSTCACAARSASRASSSCGPRSRWRQHRVHPLALRAK